jgi:5-hydroxyisourate hydrolase-like protein (transthyretin family)
MKPTLPRWFAFSALLFCVALAAQAPQQASNSAGSSPASTAQGAGHTIAGIVVNAKSGQPVHDAEVALTRTPSLNQGRVLAASSFTDDQGHFAFPNLPSGKFELHVGHRGYIGADYDQHDSGSTAIVTGESPETAALDIAHLQFLLAPQGVLYGTVTEDSGDPVPGAQISLYRQEPGHGTAGVVRASMANADEQGNYEIANLAPGSYFLSVSGSPWYLTQPQPVAGKSARQPRSPLDVAYAVTFYPDATDSAFAAPITVAAGDRIPVNLTLHPVPSLHITMQIPHSASNGVNVPQLRQEIFGTSNDVQPHMSITTPEHSNSENANTTIELSGIAPGRYELTFFDPPTGAGRTTDANLASDQNLDLSAATPLASVSGKLAAAGGGKLPQSLFLILSPQEGETRDTARIEADGSFHFRSVRPGTYELVASTGEYPMTVTQLAASGASVAGRLIKIGSDPVTFTANVAETTAILHGFARTNGKSAPGVFLLLVPSNPNAGHEAWRSNQSDSDGSFDFPQVMPGQYTLIAVQEGWTLDWSHPESIAKYLAGGLKVTVPTHAGDIPLKEAVEIQPK